MKPPTRMLKKLKSITQALLFNSDCLLCQQAAQPDVLCARCHDSLTRIKTACYQCATPLPQAGYCGQCLKRPPNFDYSLAGFHYDEPIRELIHALKFCEQIAYAPRLARLMLSAIASFYRFQSLPECLIAVPLHRQRLKERGYNQSLELTKSLAKQLSTPYLNQSCQRIIATKAQAELPFALRKKNVKSAFVCHQPPPFTHIALIDDVMTSGHTLDALAAAIKKNAPQVRIDCWTFARASQHPTKR